jgi:hypothetical protein
MSAALKTLGQQPHGPISLKAFLDHRNYCECGLMSEDEVTKRVLNTMRRPSISETDMHQAIQRGFLAARKK